MKTCVKLILFPVIFLQQLRAQVDTAFVNHLERSGLQTEFRQYITTVKSSPDSIAYLRTRYYLLYHNDSLLLSAYAGCGALCRADSFLSTRVSVRMLTSDAVQREQWFSSLERYQPQSPMLKMQQAAEHPLQYDIASLPEELRENFSKLQSLHRKKPVAAALMSMLLPGAGKLYAGKKRTSASSFITCALYAGQWAESKARLGYNHPFSWVNAGFFTVFYLTNIYSSYRSVLQLRQEYKKQFLHDAAHYYR